MAETIKLKNGREEAKPLVTVVMVSLNALMKSKPLAVYELAMKCRDRDHKIFGNLAQDLRNYKLIEDNKNESVHSSIRNIVLSAVTGDGLDMTIGNPLAENQND